MYICPIPGLHPLPFVRKSVTLRVPTHPLISLFHQVGDNIALGSPQCAHDSDKVREAARLGGAESFVDRLPEGFDTYLDRPVRDYYSGIPDGAKSLFGRPVNFGAVGQAMGGVRSDSVYLSGGQMQRLAVCVCRSCFVSQY